MLLSAEKLVSRSTDTSSPPVQLDPRGMTVVVVAPLRVKYAIAFQKLLSITAEGIDAFFFKGYLGHGLYCFYHFTGKYGHRYYMLFAIIYEGQS